MSNEIPKKGLVNGVRRASVKAVRRTQETEGAFTFQSGKKIIKKYSDGREEVLKEFDRAYFKSSKKRYKID